MHLAREIILNNCLNELSINLAHIRPTLIYGKKDPHSGYGPNLFKRKLDKNEDIIRNLIQTKILAEKNGLQLLALYRKKIQCVRQKAEQTV